MLINCDNCSTEFNRKPSEIGKNNYCSKTCNYKAKTKSDKYKKVSKFYNNAWSNMNIRCGKYTHLQTKDKCKSYVDTKILFNQEDFKKWCWNQKNLIESLNRPSIDRIDKNKHYSLDNLQIIELFDNIRKDKTVFTNTHGVCFKCKEKLTLDKFVKDRRRKNGLTNICKPCEKLRQRKKYEQKQTENTQRNRTLEGISKETQE